MKFYIIKFFIAALPFFFFSDNVWKVKSSSIVFKIKNAGLSVEGTFSELEAVIKFNPLKPEESQIKASVLSKSINTGNEMRENHLKKPEYFDAEKYPKITLQSTKIEKTGPITFIGTFNLTLKNITKQIIIPFTFIKIPEKTEFKGNFIINRKEYGVGGNSLTLGDNVTISFLLAVTE